MDAYEKKNGFTGHRKNKFKMQKFWNF